MSKKAKFDLKDIASYRRGLGMNQLQFWSRFGITQSGGSRYESGRSIPLPARALLVLVSSGKLSEQDLAAAMKAAKK